MPYRRAYGPCAWRFSYPELNYTLIKWLQKWVLAVGISSRKRFEAILEYPLEAPELVCMRPMLEIEQNVPLGSLSVSWGDPKEPIAEVWGQTIADYLHKGYE